MVKGEKAKTIGSDNIINFNINEKDLKSNFDLITKDELLYITNAFIREKGLVSHHIDSYDYFLENGVKNIVTTGFVVEGNIENSRTETDEDRSIETIEYKVEFLDVRINKPRTTESYIGREKEDLFPSSAVVNDRTYSGDMFVDVKITAKAYLVGKEGRDPIEKTTITKNIRVASIPIAIGSVKCHTKGLTREQLWSLKEDPTDTGGYFIIKGGAWVIDCVENRVFNWPHTFHNIGHSNERARLEFISKPGDSFENSSQIILRYLTDDRITIEFDMKPFKGNQFPFSVIFRLLGMTTDEEIIDNIVYGYSEENPNRYSISQNIIEILKKAFFKPGSFAELAKMYEPTMIATAISHIINPYESRESTGRKIKNVNKERSYNKNLMNMIDEKVLLPHIGKTAKYRHEKARFLGHLINRLLLVEMEIIKETDRDALNFKRIYSAGLTMAKQFKNNFNLAVIQKIKLRCRNLFEKNSFSKIELSDIVKTGIDASAFQRNIHTAVVSGNDTIITRDNQKLTNRIQSQRLEYKNPLHVKSTLRTIRANSNNDKSKSDTRSYEMRMVHPSYFGNICPVQSADTGENVGMAKQMAWTAFITLSGQSLVLKEKLLSDTDLVIPWESIYPKDVYNYNLYKIFVNGNLIGCTQISHVLVKKYRELRRKSNNISKGIDKYTSIYWDPYTNDVYFWVDMGRILYPLLIMYNTENDLNMFDEKIQKEVKNWKKTQKGKYPYYQKTLLTRNIIKKLRKNEITLTELQEAGIIEYISPDEKENCMVATSIMDVYQNETNYLNKYTHCEIEINVLGMAATTAPYGHHNQVVRQVYETNQAKQTCSIPALNWPYHIAKHEFLQYDNENPLVGTFLNKITHPNGANCIVAVICDGWNQEDSLSFNRSAIQRMLFDGTHFDYEKDEISKGERIEKPDKKTTKDIKPNCNYELLENGIIKVGSEISKGTILIGKVMSIKDPKQNYNSRDMSISYKYEEKARVTDYIRERNQEDNEIIKVKFRSLRSLGIGDKLSSRFGQKGICGMLYRQTDMPFTEEGIIPDIIMNPHAYPSRMTIGQYLEGTTAKACALGGYRTDATIFKQIDLNDIFEELESNGYNRYGKQRMFNGRTGEWMDVEIFITPIYYQRLQKFIDDQVYSVTSGTTDQTTRQPLAGKANRGGLRLGEMEKDCIVAHGATMNLMEKFRDHSDGFNIYVCQNCNRRAVVNEDKGTTKCYYCDDNSDIVRIKNSWSTNLMINEVESMGIGINLIPEPYAYEVYDNSS